MHSTPQQFMEWKLLLKNLSPSFHHEDAPSDVPFVDAHNCFKEYGDQDQLKTLSENSNCCKAKAINSFFLWMTPSPWTLSGWSSCVKKYERKRWILNGSVTPEWTRAGTTRFGKWWRLAAEVSTLELKAPTRGYSTTIGRERRRPNPERRLVRLDGPEWTSLWGHS